MDILICITNMETETEEDRRISSHALSHHLCVLERERERERGGTGLHTYINRQTWDREAEKDTYRVSQTRQEILRRVEKY